MSITSYVSDTKEKISFRPSRKAVKRAALALAVALGVAGAGHFGYDYLTTGRYLESTDDAYVKADSTIISPKVSGYIARGAGRRQPAGQGRAAAGRDRRPRFQGRAGAGRCRCRRIRSRGAQPRCAARPAAADHRAGHGRCRRRRSQSEIRAGRTGPLRRADEDRLRHGAARAADRRGAARRHRAIAAREVRPARRPAQGRRAHHRARQGGGAGRSRPRGGEPGGAQSVLHADQGAGGWHGRRALAAGRAICAGRHAIDGGRAAGCGLRGREFQGDAAHPCPQRPAGRDRDRQFPRHQAAAAMSTACRRPAVWNSRCCRRTTPPAISPRSCSACR